MRREPTPAEAVLWERIRNRRIGNARFRRQHTVEGFIVDFVCLESSLVIEVDGDIHDQPDQKAYDHERQLFLEARGFRVLRFSNADVTHALDAVADVIGEALGNK
jgi:leucyl-tRNA synthetase